MTSSLERRKSLFLIDDEESKTKVISTQELHCSGIPTDDKRLPASASEAAKKNTDIA